MIDGEKVASIKGTGGEDYFQGGWYFIDGVFNAPHHGLIVKDTEKVHASMYRFRTLDRINFSHDIPVEIELAAGEHTDERWRSSEPTRNRKAVN